MEAAGHLEEAEAMGAEEAGEPTNKTALLKKFLFIKKNKKTYIIYKQTFAGCDLLI